MNTDVMFSSKSDKWGTPQEFFDRLNAEFNFDIDVCATEFDHKCEKYFTPEIDGLKQEWLGNCWMNPPYGREQVKWLYKAVEEGKSNTNLVVCLIPARPDTKVWHEVIFKNASSVCFIKGRLKFGNSNCSAPFPSAIVVFGKTNEEQVKCLETLGKVYL